MIGIVEIIGFYCIFVPGLWANFKGIKIGQQIIRTGLVKADAFMKKIPEDDTVVEKIYGYMFYFLALFIFIAMLSIFIFFTFVLLTGKARLYPTN